jgi:hypothetical protein
MMKKLRCLCVGLIFLTFFVFHLNTNNIFDKTYSKIQKLFIRQHFALKFFEENYKAVNLDGLFGLRISQGIFQQIKQVSNKKINKIINLFNDRIQSLAEKITKQVEETAPNYYKNFKILINKPFLQHDSDYRVEVHFKSSRLLHFKNTNFDENFSDSCYSLLLNDNNIKKCSTNNDCLEFFTRKTASGYYLTHQLLYFMIAQDVKFFFFNFIF